MDQGTIRELAALVAIVSLTVIGSSMILLAAAWRGFEQTYSPLNKIERKAVLNSSFYLSLPVLALAIVYMLAGVYWTNAIQDIIFLTLLAIILLIILIETISTVRRRLTKSQPSPKPATVPMMYLLTLIFLAYGVLISFFSLLGVSSTMLGIEISPYVQQDFNSGRWAVQMAILFFTSGTIGLGITHLDHRLSGLRSKQ